MRPTTPARRKAGRSCSRLWTERNDFEKFLYRTKRASGAGQDDQMPIVYRGE